VRGVGGYDREPERRGCGTVFGSRILGARYWGEGWGVFWGKATRVEIKRQRLGERTSKILNGGRVG